MGAALQQYGTFAINAHRLLRAGALGLLCDAQATLSCTEDPNILAAFFPAAGDKGWRSVHCDSTPIASMWHEFADASFYVEFVFHQRPAGHL